MKAHFVTYLLAGLLWASANGATAGSAEGKSARDDEAHAAAHESVVQIQLIDGSVLVVLADDNVRSASLANQRKRPRAGTELSPPIPQILMRRRGQIFDPATPGVVASIRG